MGECVYVSVSVSECLCVSRGVCACSSRICVNPKVSDYGTNKTVKIAYLAYYVNLAFCLFCQVTVYYILCYNGVPSKFGQTR